MSVKISGEKYAMMYGPTTGDKVRLADTNLIIEVEKDFTIYGGECKFGGGKTLRDGMGQSVTTTSADGDLDLVITNALIVDYTGIYKADVGIKNGVIAGIGKAGNPSVMDGVTPGITVGASTEASGGRGTYPHGRRTGYAYSFYFSSADRVRFIQRHYQYDWRRNRTGGRNKCHNMYAWSLEYAKNASGGRGIPYEFRIFRKRKLF